jgi:ligand-binding sensor domain-containing protein
LTHNAYLSSNNGRALALNQNGIVWIGTDMGITLFDGVRFSWFKAATSGLISDDVRSLFCDSGGDIWVGTSAGVSRYDHGSGSWASYTTGLASLIVTAIGEDLSGNIWLGHDGAGLTRLRPGGTDVYDTSGGMSNGDVRGIAFDSTGDGWFATAGGLHRYDGAVFSVYTTSNSGIPGNDVREVLVDGADGVWTATSAGLGYFLGTWSTHTSTAGGLLSSDTHSLAAGTGAIWIGTAVGLNRYQTPTTWSGYGLYNANLPSNVVHDSAEDSTGDSWFGTDGGLTRFNGPAWTTWNSGNSPMATDRVFRVVPEGGAVWLATDSGLYRFDGVGWNTYDFGSGDLPADTVRDLALRSDTGDLWIATGGGVARRDSSAVFTSFTTADGLGSNDVRGIDVDGAGVVWAATASGLSRFDGSWTNISTATAPTLPSDMLSDVAVNSQGVWVGTDSSGVAFYDGVSFTAHGTSQGSLPSDAVRGLGASGSDLFVATAAGFARFNGGSWTVFTEANSPLMSDDVNSIRFPDGGDVHICTRGAGVSLLRLP